MARANDFKDPDYDRKLEEFKAARDRARREMGQQNVKKDTSSRDALRKQAGF
jgi:hypothetical protein